MARSRPFLAPTPRNSTDLQYGQRQVNTLNSTSYSGRAHGPFAGAPDSGRN